MTAREKVGIVAVLVVTVAYIGHAFGFMSTADAVVSQELGVSLLLLLMLSSLEQER